MTEGGIFWRSQTMSRLDAALSSSGVPATTPRRDPANLRSAARFCRELAAGENRELQANLIGVANDLDAEALEKELALGSPEALAAS